MFFESQSISYGPAVLKHIKEGDRLFYFFTKGQYMPQLHLNDNRYTLFLTQRSQVIDAASDLLAELDETNEETKSFMKTVKMYVWDYATHPQVNIHFGQFLKDSTPFETLPENEIKRLITALKNDQELMGDRPISRVNYRNKSIEAISWGSYLLTLMVALSLDDKSIISPLQALIVGAIVSSCISQFKLQSSINDWDYIGVDDIHRLVDGQDEMFQPMTIR